MPRRSAMRSVTGSILPLNQGRSVSAIQRDNSWRGQGQSAPTGHFHRMSDLCFSVLVENAKANPISAPSLDGAGRWMEIAGSAIPSGVGSARTSQFGRGNHLWTTPPEKPAPPGPKWTNKTGMGGGRPPTMMKMCHRGSDSGRCRRAGSRAQLSEKRPTPSPCRFGRLPAKYPDGGENIESPRLRQASHFLTRKTATSAIRFGSRATRL